MSEILATTHFIDEKWVVNQLTTQPQCRRGRKQRQPQSLQRRKECSTTTKVVWTENMFEITCLVCTYIWRRMWWTRKESNNSCQRWPWTIWRDDGRPDNARVLFDSVCCAPNESHIITISLKIFTGRIIDGKPTDRRRRQIEDDDRLNTTTDWRRRQIEDDDISETTLMVMIMTLKVKKN